MINSLLKRQHLDSGITADTDSHRFLVVSSLIYSYVSLNFKFVQSITKDLI